MIPYMLRVEVNSTVKMYSTDGRLIGGFSGNGNGTDQLSNPHRYLYRWKEKGVGC